MAIKVYCTVLFGKASACFSWEVQLQLGGRPPPFSRLEYRMIILPICSAFSCSCKGNWMKKKNDCLKWNCFKSGKGKIDALLTIVNNCFCLMQKMRIHRNSWNKTLRMLMFNLYCNNRFQLAHLVFSTTVCVPDLGANRDTLPLQLMSNSSWDRKFTPSMFIIWLFTTWWPAAICVNWLHRKI